MNRAACRLLRLHCAAQQALASLQLSTSTKLSLKSDGCAKHQRKLTGSKKAQTSVPNLLDNDNIGEELAGPIQKDELVRLLNNFFRQPEVKAMAIQQGMESTLFRDAFTDFRRYCAQTPSLPTDLHIKICDILRGHGSATDIFPFFLRHAKRIYPHLDSMDDLRHASDLTQPAAWFPLARHKTRKIVIHAGPTNSGKTHHAFQRFLEAKSGIYCGPLKMLAGEIATRSNQKGISCDLVTGEERKLADPDNKAKAEHVACTVEMTDLNRDVEVAIIDEIQMLRDTQRGWAWVRAFLGVNADEVHLCGEDTVIDIIRDMSLDTGDDVEVRRYKRLTPIEYSRDALRSVSNVQPGDCIVCFSKAHIYYLCRELEKLGKECAVIYGSLPPATKLAQAERFNDPDDPCKILIATDAIGMGLNLNIRRIIFYSLMKWTDDPQGKKDMDVITPSQALQIAGRSGRFGTTHEEKGYVTTFMAEDIELMHELLGRTIDPIQQAGLHPTAEQIELFAYHLPNTSLSNLLDIFTTLSTLDDSKYFMCNIEQFKQLADIIDHVPMSLKNRYVFCCAPIPLQSPFVAACLLKFVRRFSNGEPITVQWLGDQIGWPLNKPKTLDELHHLEAIHDVLDLYQWLSYRFEDQFPDRVFVKAMQEVLDNIILDGVGDITRLINASEMDKNHLRDDKGKHELIARGSQIDWEDRNFQASNLISPPKGVLHRVFKGKRRAHHK